MPNRRASPDIAYRPEVMADLAAATGRTVVVGAPGGYGKTSHVARWAERDGRPVAWVSLTSGANDPAALVAALGQALADVTDIDVTALPSGVGVSEDLVTIALAPAFGRVVGDCTLPFVLVLDDTHFIDSRPAWDVLEALAERLPPSSTVVFVGRAVPNLALGRLRVHPGVVEIARESLALDLKAARGLFNALGCDVDDGVLAELVERTEGWPVGLYLVALAIVDHGLAVSEALRDTGCDVYVADYLRDEWVAGLAPADLTFLQRLSCLDWFSPELCAEVLDGDCTPGRLDELYRSSLVVIPLDHRGSSYRLHHLLGDLLQQELRRRDPDALRDVHVRASRWFERAGDLDRAFRHALASDDLERADSLVAAYSGALQTTGRHATLLRWLGSLPAEHVHASPSLCAVGCMVRIGSGDAHGAIRWLHAATHALAANPASPELARLQVAVLRGVVEAAPPDDLLPGLEAASLGLPPGAWRGAALLALGAQYVLDGADDAAVLAFQQGIAEAQAGRSLTTEALCRSLLCLVLFDSGDAAPACRLASEARDIVERRGLGTVPTTTLVHAAAALAEATQGRPERARDEMGRARRHLAAFQPISPWLNLQVRFALVRACLLSGDQVGASTLLQEAERHLDPAGGPVWAKERLAELRVALGRAQQSLPYGPSALTTAELRVLQFLPTNLSLGAIAERLYVSRNTVKAHSISIYRKLGVSSRAAAVERAADAGLLSLGRERTA